MRVTIEIKERHRRTLRALAKERGEKSLSAILAEVIQKYLDGEPERARQREASLALRGSLSDGEARELRARIRNIRKYWR